MYLHQERGLGERCMQKDSDAGVCGIRAGRVNNATHVIENFPRSKFSS